MDGLRDLTVIFSEVVNNVIHCNTCMHVSDWVLLIQDPFIIYEDINGTAISYMVYYSHSDTGEMCHSREIDSSSCDNGIYSEEFNVLSSLCRPLSDINVTVSVVTNLGEGPQTDPIKEG